MKICKYALSETSSITNLWMPAEANIICVQVDEKSRTPCVWAIVDENTEQFEKRTFEVFGTGHSLEGSHMSYVGTYQLHGGAFVGHLFEHI